MMIVKEKRLVKHKVVINTWDWLLVIGAVLAPMTGWRIWKVGPAEVLCFLWAIRKINLRKIKLGFMEIFFCVFLTGMLIGTLICLYVAPLEVRLDSWPTWIFIGVIACALYSGIKQNDIDYNICLFDKICVLSVLWYSFLYIYSLVVSRRFLGAPLWYARRYSGGGTNPHQLAVLMCGIAFWFLFYFSKSKSFKHVLFFAATLYLLFETKSSTGIASIAVALFVFVAIWIVTAEHKRTVRAMILTAEIVIFVSIITVFHSFLYRLAYEWISEDPNGLGRFYIWSSFRQAFIKSPLFGLGPGTHGISYSGMKEFHNSYLEIIAASGIIGLIAFIVLTYIITKKIVKSTPQLLPIIIAIYGYSMAGFAFRRLAYWVVMIFTIVIAEGYYNVSNDSLTQNELAKQNKSENI